MRTFKTLNEVIDYIPNCLICQKGMTLSIDGVLSSQAGHHPRWSRGLESVKLKMGLVDGFLRSNHKNDNISICVSDNKIIDGWEIVNRLMPGTTYVRKMCLTCHFKIHTYHIGGAVKKENCFPPLTMHSEELHYTMKGGKDVRVTKYYHADGSLTGEYATIKLDNKFLPPVPLDFDKFKDLVHLNKRLATIKLFH